MIGEKVEIEVQCYERQDFIAKCFSSKFTILTLTCCNTTDLSL